jgi:hypothetical protein
VGVVIHNTVNGEPAKPEFPTSLTYPSLEPTSVMGTVVEKALPSIYPTPEQDELEFYKELALTFAKILRHTDGKLLANIIDPSGKIIVEPGSLCKMISLLLHCPIEDIHIEIETRPRRGSGGCVITKTGKICKVEAIKINHTDFHLGFNEKYNILTDSYSISLKKVYVGIEY